ncbi:MAG: glycosyltransferase [Bacteroidales bacterium]
MKMLMLLSRCPYPLEKGDKLRAYHQLKEWSKKYEIHLFFVTWTNPSSTQIEALSFYCKSITFVKLNCISFFCSLWKFVLKKQALQCAFFYSRRAQKQFDILQNQLQPELVFCQLVRMTPYTKTVSSLKILDYQDAFSSGLYRRLQVAPWYLRWPLRYEYRAMKAMENQVFSQFDIKTIISAQDRDLISHPHKNEIKILPNGVDTTYFDPAIATQKEKELAYMGTFDIVFTGNMSYPPNEDAAVFLVKKIYPLLKVSHPNLRILIAGATPSLKVKALAASHICVSGWMDDIRMAYLAARIFVAPMRLGSGMQNKLLEAMSMQLACLITPLVSKGLNEKGKEPEVFEVCEATAEAFADKITCLLKDSELQLQMGQQARSYVMNTFSWEAQSSKLSQWIINLQH